VWPLSRVFEARRPSRGFPYGV